MPEKPTVIVFGGLHTAARALGRFLVPAEGEPLVSHVRFVDKYSVHPPTTYIGYDFPKLLQNPIVEYKQVNVTNEAAVVKAFDPPEGHSPYSYVFDMTGEIRSDRSEVIHIDQTAVPAFILGKEAQKRNVKAYVRLTGPYYDTSLEKTAHEEHEKVAPWGAIGTWHHEALRILASMDNLNLIIVRTGIVYGPWVLTGLVTPSITLGLVYRQLKQEMKWLWSPGVRMNTVHVDDVAAASWMAGEWIASHGRSKGNELAGELMYFANDKAKVKDIKGAPDPKEQPKAPFFNLVDTSDTTLGSVGESVGKIFGIQTGFHGFVHNTMASLKLDDVLEEVNELHMEAWTQVITESEPPVPNTPLTPYLDESMLAKRSVAFKGGKIQRILGYHLKHPLMNEETLRATIAGFKAEGTWPNWGDLVV